jgi:hypothetical protein
MKPQAQDRTKTKWAVGLFSVAILVVLYDLLPSRSASPMPEVRENKAVSKAVASKEIREFSFRPDLLERRRLVSFESGRNIFRMQEEKHESVADFGNKGIDTLDPGTVISHSETVVPIDLRFFGYFRKSGESKKILVSQGDVVFVAQEGGLVGLRYKIIEIKNNAVVVRDVLSNQEQSLGLTQ